MFAGYRDVRFVSIETELFAWRISTVSAGYHVLRESNQFRFVPSVYTALATGYSV